MVVSAYNYWQNYLKDKQGEAEALVKAKEYIDGVTETKELEKAKTWYYKGSIYYEIAVSKNPIHTGLTPDAMLIAAESFQKCISIDPRYEFANNARMQLRNASGIMLNNGVNLFNAKDYAGALAMFDKCIKVAEGGKAFDTLAVRNGVLASLRGGNYDKAIDYINKLLAVNYGGAGTYADLSNAYISKGDTAAAIKAIADGRAKYPKSSDLVIADVNFLITKKDYIGSEKALNDAIALDPTNVSLYYAAGTNYNTLEQYDKAEELLKKAVEMKPDYGDALYNLGAVHVNKGNDLKKKQQKFEEDRKFKEADELKPKIEEQFKLAVEFLERAKNTIPDPKKDANTLDSYIMYVTALKTMYGNLEMNDKFMEMKKLLDDLRK